MTAASDIRLEEPVVVFVKAPRPGTVKTRLAATLGPDAACSAYRRLAEHLLAGLAPLREVELRFAPDDGESEIEPWLRPGWSVHPQGEGDLGMRLERAFADHFARGARRVVVIGSDCPDVGVGDVREAMESLGTHDLVVGPARDGGYWLIGLSIPAPALFRGIAWSTGEVLQQTLACARRIHARWRLLRELTDVDTESEWREFLRAQDGPEAEVIR